MNIYVCLSEFKRRNIKEKNANTNLGILSFFTFLSRWDEWHSFCYILRLNKEKGGGEIGGWLKAGLVAVKNEVGRLFWFYTGN